MSKKLNNSNLIYSLVITKLTLYLIKLLTHYYKGLPFLYKHKKTPSTMIESVAMDYLFDWTLS